MSSPRARTIASHWLAPFGLAIVTVLALSPPLLNGGPEVLGADYTDLALQCLSFREFAFRELAHGHLPLAFILALYFSRRQHVT